MNRNFAIRRLLAILVIAGLALAPLSGPVMAGMASAMSMQSAPGEMSAAMTSSEMSSNMPCCPSKTAPVPFGCDKCLYMTACMSKCLTGLPSTSVHPLLTASDDIAALRNESWPDGLNRPPPEHPPRILV